MQRVKETHLENSIHHGCAFQIHQIRYRLSFVQINFDFSHLVNFCLWDYLKNFRQKWPLTKSSFSILSSDSSFFVKFVNLPLVSLVLFKVFLTRHMDFLSSALKNHTVSNVHPKKLTFTHKAVDENCVGLKRRNVHVNVLLKMCLWY